MKPVPGSARRTGVLLLIALIGLACGRGGQEGGLSRSPAIATPTAHLALKFSSTDATGQPDGSIRISMKNAQYSPHSISLRSGKVVFYLVNDEALQCGLLDCRHDMVITTSDKETLAYSDTIEPGKAKVFTIESMPSGQYPFHDDIGVHFVELNMAGSLDVT